MTKINVLPLISNDDARDAAVKSRKQLRNRTLSENGCYFGSVDANIANFGVLKAGENNVGGGGGKKEMDQLHYKDLFPVSSSKDADRSTSQFLQEVLDILMDYVRKSNDRKTKILDWHQPNQLREAMDFSLPDEPQNLDQVLVDCKDALKYQVKSAHPYFFNQLSQGLDVISMAGEWLAATANSNMFTYEVAPVFTIMEQEVFSKMREIIGFTDGDSIFAPGGSISNMYALIVARHKFYPEHKHGGMRGLSDQLVCYTSAQCHYSIKGAAATIGIGLENCVAVPCDHRGRMIASELDRLISRDKADGKRPFFVNATAGTTVTGCYDPINDIADIAERQGLWLHIDAAWGGGLLVSEEHRGRRFRGVERADSLTWNPHKLLGVLLQCSTFHMKEKGLLNDCNSMSADYLFQPDKHYDVSYDTGDKVVQCGRHNDVFKFWLMWRAKGLSGMRAQMDRLMSLRRYQVDRMREMSDRFHLLYVDPEDADDYPDCVNVCFWYVPKRLRNVERDRQWEEELGKVTARVKSKMMIAGTLMVSYQPLGDRPNFFRSIVSNQATTEDDIDYMLKEIDRMGEDL